MTSRPILASFLAPISASVPLALIYIVFVLLSGRPWNVPEGSFPIILIGLLPVYAISCLLAFVIGKLFIRLGLTSLRCFLSAAIGLAIALAVAWIASTEGMRGSSPSSYIAGIAICSVVFASCSTAGAYVWWAIAAKPQS